MVEVAEIAYQKRENCIKLIVELVAIANIGNFHKNQIDIHHQKPMVPFSLSFYKKRDRINFYSQRKKVRDLAFD